MISTLLLGGRPSRRSPSPGSFPVDPFFFLIALTYGLTIVYALTLRYRRRHRGSSTCSSRCDALIVSAFIYLTGGITSYFSSLYVLPIIAASVVQVRRGGLIVATLSAVLYVGLVLAQYLPATASPRPVARDQRGAARRVGGAVHRGAEHVRLLRGRAAQRIAGRERCAPPARGSSGRRPRSRTCRRSTST